MLKITMRGDERQTFFELEGRLAGPWVQELRRCWENFVGDCQLGVSLKAVTFIDEAGRRLLAEMHGEGIAIEGSGCMTAAIIDEIVRAGKT